MENDNSKAPDALMKEIETTKNALKETLEKIDEFGSIHSKLKGSNNSLIENSQQIKLVSAEMQKVSESLFSTLESFKKMINAFTKMDNDKLIKQIKNSEEKFQIKIKDLESSLKANNKNNEVHFNKTNELFIKTQKSINKIENSLSIIIEQTKKKGLFS